MSDIFEFHTWLRSHLIYLELNDRCNPCAQGLVPGVGQQSRLKSLSWTF